MYQPDTLGYLEESLYKKGKINELNKSNISLKQYGLEWRVVKYTEIENLARDVWQRHYSDEYVRMSVGYVTSTISRIRLIVKLSLREEIIQPFHWNKLRFKHIKHSKHINGNSYTHKELMKLPHFEGDSWEKELLEFQEKIQKAKSELTALLHDGIILAIKVYSDLKCPQRTRRVAESLRDLCETTTDNYELKLT